MPLADNSVSCLVAFLYSSKLLPCLKDKLSSLKTLAETGLRLTWQSSMQ